MLAKFRNTIVVKNCMKSSCAFSTQNRTCEEIRIPVPWGHLAGKWWGPQDKRPILATHGWQDNCGTFDTLIPLLPKHLGFLAVDFPGHGLSSRLPPGVFYHGIDSVITLQRIVEYFNWPKVSFLGHSMGAITNFTYTILYPNNVDFLICLDGLKPLVFPDRKIERMVKTISSFLKYDQLNCSKNEPPCYPLHILENMLHEGTRKSISLEACKHILKRNVAPSTKEPDKFYFTRDGRLKASGLLSFAQEDIVESARRLSCPTFLSKASHSPFFEKKENALEVMEVIRATNDHFEYHDVEGTHHVHLNHPERLADLINGFIKKYDVEDRSVGGLKQELKFTKLNVANLR